VSLGPHETESKVLRTALKVKKKIKIRLNVFKKNRQNGFFLTLGFKILTLKVLFEADIIKG